MTDRRAMDQKVGTILHRDSHDTEQRAALAILPIQRKGAQTGSTSWRGVVLGHDHRVPGSGLGSSRASGPRPCERCRRRVDYRPKRRCAPGRLGPNYSGVLFPGPPRAGRPRLQRTPARRATATKSANEAAVAADAYGTLRRACRDGWGGSWLRLANTVDEMAFGAASQPAYGGANPCHCCRVVLLVMRLVKKHLLNVLEGNLAQVCGLG